jgi:hypothetical protein
MERNEAPEQDLPTVIELKPPDSMFDTGTAVWGPRIKNAVESMITTGCVVILYQKQTLGSLYRNVLRRNLRKNNGLTRDDPGFVEYYKLWTHQLEPADEAGEGKWIVRLRKPNESVNPFFSAENDSRYGRWLVLAEQLVKGEPVEVASETDVRRLAQSFRFSCDRRGYQREGRMLRTVRSANGWTVTRVKGLLKADPAAAKATKEKLRVKKKPLKAKK